MAEKDNQKQQQKKAEEKQEQKREQKKQEKEKKPHPQEILHEETLIRVLGRDIPGSRNILTGLTKIKGVSWAIANATCIKLNLPKNKKVSEISKEEIAKIETFLQDPEISNFLKNRRRDFETGESKHLVSSTLDMRKDFDIRRLKKIRSYKGIRHTAGLPVRGQRTRSHFRKKGQVKRVKR